MKAASLSQKRHLTTILRVVIPYLVFAGIWIYFSDSMLVSFFAAPQQIFYVSLIKGMLFIAISGLIIGLLLATELRKRSSIEQKYRLIVEGANEGILTTDPQGTITFVNQKLCEMFVCPANELLGMRYDQFLHDPADQNWGKTTARNPEFGQANRDIQLKRRDGTDIWVLVNLSRITDDQGHLQGMLAMVTDITERKQTEDMLRENEEHFRLFYENAPIGYQSLDENGCFVDVNPTWLETLGYTREEVLGRSFGDFMIPEHRQLFQRRFPMFKQRGFIKDAEFELVRKDGQTIVVNFSGKIGHNAKGEFEQTHCVFQDITQSRRAEQALRQQEEETRVILNTVPAMIWYLDREHHVVRSNQAAARALGMDVGAMLGKSTTELFPTDAETYTAENEAVMRSGQPMYNIVQSYPNHDGTRRWVITDKIPYKDNRGNTVGVIVFANDITDRIERETELETLLHVSGALRQARTVQDIYEKFSELLVQLMNLSSITIMICEDDFNMQTVVCRGALVDQLNGKVCHADSDTHTYQVIKTRQPFVTDKVQEDASLKQWFTDPKIRNLACVPLISQQQAIGVIWAGSTMPISQHQVRLLSTLAEIATNAILRAGLHEKTHHRLQRLSALHTIDITITSSLDAQFTLSVLLTQVIEHMGVDASAILMLNPATQMLEYAHGQGFKTNMIPSTRLRLGESYGGRVAIERKPLAIPNLAERDDPTSRTLRTSSEHFQAYFAAPLIAKGQVRGVLELFNYQPKQVDDEWLDFLQALATQAAIAIDNAELFDKLQRSNDEITMAYDATIAGWSRALELRDDETQGHSLRVTEMTIELAARMGVSAQEIPHYRRGVLLHDIGKMAIPDHILHKPGPLTSEEWEIMRKHPVYAHELLSPIPYLREALQIPYSHHERWDGSGYPRGLRGEEIPLPARIFAVVDAWDALIKDRPYRPAWPPERAKDYIRENAGKLFDPAVVVAFLDMMEEKSWEAAQAEAH